MKSYIICRLAPSIFLTVSGRLITDDEIDLGQVYIIWNISLIPPVEYVHPLGLLTSNPHSLQLETAFGIGEKSMEY